jgi:effector-binding domain-containing protein
VTSVVAMTDLAPVRHYSLGEPLTLDPVPLAVLRHEGVTLDDIRDLFDTGYSAIGGLIGSGAIVPAGPALAIYHGDPMGRFDLELGFPVVDPLNSPMDAGSLSVIGSTLPAGPALAATHLGSYDDLGDAWGRLAETPGGPAPTGVWIEVYVSDPTSGQELRTDLLMPVTA